MTERAKPTQRWSAMALLTVVLVAGCEKPDDQATVAPPAAAPPATAAQQSTLNAADCDRLADPAPTDNSAAGRATAISQGMAARQACKRAANAGSAPNQANADLARIRAIKEQEVAEKDATKISEAEWKERMRKGANAPLRELKY